MYGYRYVQVVNGRHVEDRNPYRFEPGEPDDLEVGSSGDERVLGPLVGYAFTIVLVMTLSWVFGSDSPGVSAAGLPWLGG